MILKNNRFCLILFFILFSFSILEAKNLTIKVSNTPLEQVMGEVKKQSGFEFVYQKNLLPKGFTVTLNLKDATL